MPRQDGRIEQGQSLKTAISARAWNRAQDAADIVLGQRYGSTAGPIGSAEKSVVTVKIRNNSGYDIPWLGVLAISGAWANPAFVEYSDSPVLIGVVPQAGTAVVVTMEPIARWSFGRAAVAGCFSCRVNVTNENHWYAMARHGDFGQLESAFCGPIKLVWKPFGTGQNKFAIGVM